MTFELLGILFVLLTKECLDTSNYRLFITLSEPSRLTENPITWLYFIYKTIFSDPYLITNLLSITIYTIYNLSVLNFLKSKLKSFSQSSFFYLIPISFTPVFTHFFSCTLKQGFSTLALSSLLLYASNLKKINILKITIISLLLLLSVVLHWSTTLILICWISTYPFVLFMRYISRIFISSSAALKLKIKYVLKKKIIYLSIGFLIIIFCALNIFLNDADSIIYKTVLYLYGEESNNVGYGTKYPITAIFPTLYLFISNKGFLNKNILSLTIIFAALSSSILGIYFFQGPFVRLNIALVFFAILYHGICLANSNAKFLRTNLIIFTLTLPSLFYTINHLKFFS